MIMDPVLCRQSFLSRSYDGPEHFKCIIETQGCLVDRKLCPLVDQVRLLNKSKNRTPSVLKRKMGIDDLVIVGQGDCNK